MTRLETLKRRADFLKAKAGRKWTAPAFVLQALARPARGNAAPAAPRFGFTVSQRAVAAVSGAGRKKGGAVKRNRARRRLKEAVRLTAAKSARPGYDYVIIGRGEALECSFGALLKDMERAFSKIHAGPYGKTGGAPAHRRERSKDKDRRPDNA